MRALIGVVLLAMACSGSGTGGPSGGSDGSAGGTNDGGPGDGGSTEEGADAGTPADAGSSVASGPCDDGLQLADVDPRSAARAIGVCDLSSGGASPGLVSARYVRANGTPLPSGPGLQAGLARDFGPNVHVQEGKTLLVLSTGHARTPIQPGACQSESCATNAPGSPPAGFPSAFGACPVPMSIADDVALELNLVAPPEATGFEFLFDFYSFNVPEWVCTPYDDQFVALVTPAPDGVPNGNVALVRGQPVGSLSAVEVCDSSLAPRWCASGDAACPALPVPYCAEGTAPLAGTGFDTWAPSAGATGWVRAAAPIAGGSAFTLRLAIWDGGDQTLDSTVLIDGFRWTTGAGP